jgi:hypothetical protein
MRDRLLEHVEHPLEVEIPVHEVELIGYDQRQQSRRLRPFGVDAACLERLPHLGQFSRDCAAYQQRSLASRPSAMYSATARLSSALVA